MAPGLIVGGWFASSIISKLITELIECAKDHKKKLGLKDELARLQQQLPKIEAFLHNVDQDLIREKNPPLDSWLWQLRDAADQANNVMDDMEYHLAKGEVKDGKNKGSKSIYIVKTFLEHVVDKKTVLNSFRKAVKKLDEVAADVDRFYNLMKRLVEEQDKKVKSVMESRDATSGLNVRIFGRDKEKKNIITKLLNPEYKNKDVNYAVLPLIGAGGIGKTALAQCVYNDNDVMNHFNLRMWVCVSNNFDKVLLTKKLYESAFEVTPNLINSDVIYTKLEGKLKSERFLVIFDDACYDNNNLSGWEDLFGLFKFGKSGSMILLTARDERVVTLINAPNLMDSVFLEGLDKDGMWGLFKECAFGNKDPRYHEQLVEIGREIMNKKLRLGSPLAAKTVGAILRLKFNEEHWRSVLNNGLWSLEQEPNGIMPAYLRLTYHYLPSKLKPCFSFCSIFPQDHIFIKNDLIYMWIALGLVPRGSNEEKKPEDVGSEYFEEMLNISIFSLVNLVSNTDLRYPAYTYYIETEKQFVEGYIMHDLMHDLSASVAQGECFRCDIDKLKSVPTTVRHLFIHVGDHRVFKLSEPLKNVRTLILQFNDSNDPNQDCVNKLLKEMKNLRVLTLFALIMTEVPTSVSDNLHLRYLNLVSSFFLTVFPQSMSRLYLLETLVCGGYRYDGQADVFVKLINMRHLIASEFFVEMIANIGKLTSLQELSFWVGRESGFEICQLRDMRELRHLSISNINDVDSHKEAIEAKLRDKHSLRKLSLQWNAEKFDEEVFDMLEPHFGLKELTITNYMGGRPPVWWKDQSSTSKSLPLAEGLLQKPEQFVALEKLTLSKCYNLELPYGYLNKFASLKKLDIIDCPKINLFVLALFLPFPSICINGTYVDLNADDLHELSLQPTLQEEEASLFVIDCPDSSLVRFSRMRDHYTCKWPPTWFSQNLSMLEHLRIDGQTYTPNYLSHEVSNPVNQLLSLLKQTTRNVNQCLEMVLPSDMLELKQLYFATQNIEQMQCLKKLTVTPFSKSCVIPPLPHTLKELTLSYLGLQVIPNLFINQSSELERMPSLVSLNIDFCTNLVSFAKGLLEKPEQFPALKNLTISYCTELMYLPKGLSGFISLKTLYIDECPKLFGIPPLPLTLEVLRLSRLGMDVIWNLYENQSRGSGRLQSLVALTIERCLNLVSLAEGLLQNPERFPALEDFKISRCEELVYLPGFNGFISLKTLDIDQCPKLCSIPPLPLTLEELTLSSLGMDVISNIYGNQSSESGRLSSLVALTIRFCPNLVSLAEGLLHKREQFPSLKELRISFCSGLMYLPGDFSGFISLRILDIYACPKLCAIPPLPLTLEELRLSHLGMDVIPNLYENQSRESGRLSSLVALTIYECSNLVSLAEGLLRNPEQFPDLKELTISDCEELVYLPERGFNGFISLRKPLIYGCPKLQGQLP